ncbi:PAS domain-containing sensor histidine kinase [Eleftheria terrae]|uniref:PAS domain-containing sensor histidine kinase n=1 Tax=Eleftheria terrae TaxID=1597781 RepID=UPI00263B5C9E|nr:PAS domain-containing sensor histidine kinase [Eleftheria terrae]WKB56106.1 ATP-binding protein [Eleftheria terrae]
MNAAQTLQWCDGRHAPCGLMTVADDGRVLAANEELLTLLGRSSDTLRGLHLTDVLSPGARLYAEIVVLPALHVEGRVDEVELVLLDSTGRELHVLASARRRPARAGLVNEFALLPLRQRRQLEDKLLQARRTADQLPGVLFCLVQGHGGRLRLDYASKGFAELTGLEPPTLAEDATPLLDAVHPDDLALLRSCIDTAQDEFAPRPLTLRLGGPARARWVRAHVKGSRQSGGGLVWRGALYDVTEQHKLEERLRDHDKLQAVIQLAAGVAHDFNNLLGSMIGLAELCQAEAAAGSRQLRNLGRIVDAGEKAAGLVRQLLDFARQTPQRLEAVSLTQFVEHRRALLAAGLPAGVGLVVEVEQDCAVTIDQAQLEQCMLNLVNNAAYAMRRQGGRVRLTVGMADTPTDVSPAVHGNARMARLQVADSGEGIPPELMSKIFEPFFTTKPVGEGTGLGLAAVHGIVAHHGGHVLVHSEPSAGTVFSLLLPPASTVRTRAISTISPDMTS